MPILTRYPPRNCKISDWLIDYASNVTSQGGEDGIIQKIFEVIQPTSKTCVEIGAWDGKHLSNTWNLLMNYDWNGVLIEADANRCIELKQRYAFNDKVECLQRLVTFEGNNSLDNLLSSTHVASSTVDMISIDVDGADYHLWDSLKMYQPRLVIIEFNPTIPNNIVYIQDKSMGIQQGSSLLALVELGKQKGYELISTTTFNAFFVKAEDYALFHIEDNSLDNMHNVPMSTEIFQLYDGTLKITGCKKFIWHKIPINEARLQQLSLSQRKFPCAPTNCDELSELENIYCLHKTNKEDAMSQQTTTNIYEHFLKEGKRLFGIYSDEQVRKVFGYALDLADDDDQMKCFLTERIVNEYLSIANSLNDTKRQLQWCKCALYLNSNSYMKSKIIVKMAKLYYRNGKYDKTLFWIQQALNYSPKVAATAHNGYDVAWKYLCKLADTKDLEESHCIFRKAKLKILNNA